MSRRSSQRGREAAQVARLQEEIAKSVGRPVRVTSDPPYMRIGDGAPELPPLTSAARALWRPIGYLAVIAAIVAILAVLQRIP
jgi:hypothetical protein